MKKVLVIDNGGYTYVAPYLQKCGFEVSYYNRWESAFPTVAAQKIGVGIPSVEKVLDWEDEYEGADLIYFTDIYFRGTANHLKKLGKKVWGSGNMETQERDRGLFIETLKEAGLFVPITKEVAGIDKLKNELKGMKDVWIKVSEYRGISETWKFIDKRFSEDCIRELEIALGIFKNEIPIYVQVPFGNLEYGCDLIVSNGKISPNCPIGFEFKDKSYIQKFDEFTNLPKELQECHTKYLEEVQKTDAFDYVGHLSTEVRVDEKGKHFFSDVTVRCGMPSSCSMYYGCSNFKEVVESAMEGDIKPFKPSYKYVVELEIKTLNHSKWNPIYFDDKYKDQIFLVSYAIDDGYTYQVPSEQLPDSFAMGNWVSVGVVCGGGETPEKALKEAKEAMDSIDGLDLMKECPTIEDINETIDLIEKQTGYKF
ncbi:MAG: hypothetical protein ACYDHY_19110 [Acidiferrobacterales bacterium]